ncbi:MAG TPA: DUF3667 domain-containing protein [Cryomorphaceae bacterium]|nr:DUF3667 domain-containing protein [Cryomorphaceae bacterium]
MKDFIGDFFQDYFAVDSKFFRSILLLMVKPGRLTKQFNEGKRQSYIAPFRMYLFTSFIYFFLLSLSVKQSPLDLGMSNDELKEQKVMILDSLLSVDTGNIAIAGLRSRIDSLQQKEVGNRISIDGEEFEEGGLKQYFLEHVEKANNNPDSFLRALFRVASISLFFLLPVFAVVLWIFHFRRNSFYVQHLVHALHIHTFGFALLSIYLLIGFWSEVETFGIIPLILLLYFVWSLKVVYSQKVFTSFIKSITILIAYFIIVLLSLVPALLLAIVTV